MDEGIRFGDAGTNDARGRPLIVERRPVQKRSLVLRLPCPPPPSRVATSSEAAERLQRWGERAVLSLPKSRARLSGPVEIAMRIEQRPGRHFDGIARRVIGFLAARGVIDDDSGETVRSIFLCWSSLKGVAVEITPFNSRGERLP